MNKYPLPAVLIDNNGTYRLLLKHNSESNEYLVLFAASGRAPKKLTFEEIQEMCADKYKSCYLKRQYSGLNGFTGKFSPIKNSG